MRSANHAVVLAVLLVAELASGEGFSIDTASPSVSAGSNSAILSSGPVGGPPTVVQTPGSLGLAGGIADEINAMTFGAASPGQTLHFSVDRASVGLAGNVVAEAATGQAAGDLYSADLAGTNALVINQSDLGLAPAILSGTAALPPVDNLDAFDFADTTGGLIVIALKPGHPLVGTAVGCGGDLFFAGSLFLGHPLLGLPSCLDDIDGLEVDTTTNTFFYSLAPGSPSLLPGSSIGGCVSGCSAADIFSISVGASSATRFASASALGLLASDNVDALAFTDPAPAVPALGSRGLFALAAAMLLVQLTKSVRRRRGLGLVR